MKFPRTLLLGILMLVVALGGCASTGGSGDGIGDPNLISNTEIAASDARNAQELIEHLRPRWMQMRFNRSPGGLGTTILVYQNNTRLGGLDALRDIPVQGIHSIRYMGSAEAGRLPGAGAG
jgi:hypothetical protein